MERAAAKDGARQFASLDGAYDALFPLANVDRPARRARGTEESQWL